MSRFFLVSILFSIMFSGCFVSVPDDVSTCDDDATTGDDDATTGDDDSAVGDDDSAIGDDDSADNEPAIDEDEDGYSTILDCDDTDPNINPVAPEICDELDNDCDGVADNDLPVVPMWPDEDGDGYGDGQVEQNCGLEGFAPLDGDCNDSAADIHPGATDIPGDWIDSDCDDEPVVGDDDDAAADDQDGDGYSAVPDCDDSDPAIFPGAPELCDGVDNDCDSTVDEGCPPVPPLDTDSDGDPDTTDCDDNDPTVYTGAPELCDGVDNDCDGEVDSGFVPNYPDGDGDGYGDDLAGLQYFCQPTAGWAPQAGDCDDSDPVIHPGASELCDGLDNNCDGVAAGELDQDADGYLGCEDCDDQDATINPSVIDGFDGLDNDCDGTADEAWDAWISLSYGFSAVRILNHQVYWDADDLGGVWDSPPVPGAGSVLSDLFQVTAWPPLADACGVRLNVTEAIPATGWYCEAAALDAAVAVDIWWRGSDGQWDAYDESDLVVWLDTTASGGSCSALLVTNPASWCQP